MDPKTKSAKLESRIYMRQPVKGWCYRKAPDTIRNPELLFRLKKGASIRAKGMGYPDLDDLFLSGNLIQWIGEGDSRPRYPKRMATCWRRGDATENLRDWVAKALPLQYLKLLTWALIVGGRGLNPIFFFWRSGISNILSTRQKNKIPQLVSPPDRPTRILISVTQTFWFRCCRRGWSLPATWSLKIMIPWTVEDIDHLWHLEQGMRHFDVRRKIRIGGLDIHAM